MSLVFSPLIWMLWSSILIVSTPLALNSSIIFFHAITSMYLSESVYFLASLFVVINAYCSFASSDSGKSISSKFLITHGINVSSFHSCTFGSSINLSIAVIRLSPPRSIYESSSSFVTLSGEAIP